MKCIGGAISPNGGEIAKPKSCQIGYLPQEGIHIKSVTLWNETESAFGEAKRIVEDVARLDEKLLTMDTSSDEYMELLMRIGDLEIKLEHFNPATMKPRIESVLVGLGFKRSDFERDCSEFSGGWQMRIAMAKLFLQEPDVLLLDEPTNHLDIDSQTWMEEYLFAYPGAIIIISHDLALLDALTTRTIAFAHGKAEEYAGNYSFFMHESKLRKEIQIKAYDAQQKEIEKTKAFIARFRAKASKASQAQSRLKQLEKMVLIEIQQEDAVMSFKFPSPPNSGQSVAKLENTSKTYGENNIFNGFSYEVEKGERFAIVGPNGAGKSTFCRLITGQEAPDSGEFILGGKSALSFFSQNHADELDPDRSVLETCQEVASSENAPLVRNILGCFLFRGDDVFKKVGVLSGGERSRVALVKMLVQPANFLILDEPTNHLDVQSQKVLQNALLDYPGAYMIVSHNRAFLDPIVTKTIEFRPGEHPQTYHGNVTYYLEKKEDDRIAAKAASKNQTAVRKSNKPTQLTTNELDTSKMNRKELKRYEAQQRFRRNQILNPLKEEFVTVETTIAEVESAQATLTEHMSKPEIATDGAKMQEANISYSTLTEKLEITYSRWSELSEKIEQLESELTD